MQMNLYQLNMLRKDTKSFFIFIRLLLKNSENNTMFGIILFLVFV